MISRPIDTRQRGSCKGIVVAALVYLAIVLGLSLGVLSVSTAFAWGTAEIVHEDPDGKLVFLAAATDDPPGAVDPGLAKDVARCTARVRNGASISISIYNGYPGYTCTVQTTIENRGEGAARLQALEFDVPPGLAVSGPEYPVGLVLQPADQEEQRFTLRVGPEADEMTRYRFLVRELFGPAE